jgi:hypothetical protein
VLSRLSAGDRAVLESLLASAWYPFELGKRLDQAIVDELGGGRAEFFEKLGEASAEKNLGATGVHRRDYEKTGKNEALLTTRDAQTFSAPDCLTVVGWHRRALAMCGAQAPRVVEEECRALGGDVCRYRLRWS